MDVKELNQFESVYQPSKEITYCWGVKKYVHSSVEGNHTDIADHANDSLRIWQAAKAQAIPEGYVVVPKEPTEKMIDAGMDNFCFPLDNGRFYSHDIILAYKAMIEAQEQANESE